MKIDVSSRIIGERDAMALLCFSWTRKRRHFRWDGALAQVFLLEGRSASSGRAMLFLREVDLFPSSYLAESYASRDAYYEGTPVCPCYTENPREQEKT